MASLCAGGATTGRVDRLATLAIHTRMEGRTAMLPLRDCAAWAGEIHAKRHREG